MRSVSVLGALCGLSFLLASAASAEPVYIEVPANRSTTLASQPSWNAQCKFNGYPHIKITGAPAHGRLNVGQAPNLVVPANAGNCAGAVVGGTVLSYTPNRGFQGQDSASLVIYSADRKTYTRVDLILSVQ